MSGLSTQLATLQRIRGNESSAEAFTGFSEFTGLVGAVYDIGKIANNADKLSAQYDKIDGNWSRRMNYSAKRPVGVMYADVLSPLDNMPFVAAEYGIPGSANRPACGMGKPTSGGAVKANDQTNNLNGVLTAVPAPSYNMAGTTPIAISGGGGALTSKSGDTFSKVSNAVSSAASKVSNSISKAVSHAVSKATTAISNAVKSIASFFSSSSSSSEGSSSGGKKGIPAPLTIASLC